MDLSIIIINYKTPELTRECIDSLNRNVKGVSAEIILIDNNSQDHSAAYLKEIKSQIPLRIIINNDNKGFAKANNQGMKMAKGNYILLLNSDTVVKENIFSEMLAWMSAREKVGIVSCALRNKDGSLQGTGGSFPTLFKVFAWMFFLEDIPLLDSLIDPFHPMHASSPFYKGGGQFVKAREKDWVTGAFFLLKKELVREVGYFDEDYFMYTEEVDLCFRAKKKGWKVWYLPEWNIVHLGGASSTSEFAIVNEYKGIKTFYKKNLPSWQMAPMRMCLKCGAILRIILFGLLKGSKVAAIYVKAFQIA